MNLVGVGADSKQNQYFYAIKIGVWLNLFTITYFQLSIN